MQTESITTNTKLQDQTERPGYKKTMLGWIPEGWSIKTLGTIGTFSKGKGINKSTIKQDGLPCIRYAEIYTKYDNYTETFRSFIDKSDAANSKSIQAGDLLFAGSGETLEDIGKCIAYLGETPAFAGGDIIILRPKGEDSQFLGLLLNHDTTNRQTHKLGQGHSVVHIYSSGLKHLKVPLPPLPEQQKIAKILSTWDTAIATQEQLIAAKETFKKGLMQVLLTGKKRFEGFTDNWREKTLEELGAFFRGKGIKKSEIKDVGIPCIRYAEIYTKYDNYTENFISFIDEYEALKSKEIQNGDLLFAGSGETLEDIGKCVGYLGDVPAFAGGDIIILRQKNQDVKFLGLLLNHDIVNRQTYKLGQGHSVVHIYSSSLKNVKIPLPSIEEQQKIASILSGVDKEIELLKNQLDKLQDQKRGLMQRLLTGQVRVKV